MNRCEHCLRLSDGPEDETCPHCGVGIAYFDRRNSSPSELETRGIPVYTGCCDAARDYLAETNSRMRNHNP